MSDNLFIVKEVIKSNNTITYKYKMSGLWNKFINCEEKLYSIYSDNIENVDDSIAIIPLLVDILPIAWVFDLNIEVQTIDKDFFEGLKNVKLGYQNMYPKLNIAGNMVANKIVKNNNRTEEAAVMFSGGVDAYSTLITHIEEKPYIFTIFGADIDIEDKKGYETVNEINENVAKIHNLKYKSVISNFRKFINYMGIMKELSKICDFEWWHDFQHGIALLGLIAPYTQLYNLKNLYIASSFTKEQIGMYTCASDPTIDNYVAFGNTRVIHDGYEFYRQQKIQNICEYVKKTNQNVKLRVCWESSGGKNCCECEKCYRTIMGIIAEKENPNKYGFELTKEKYDKMIKRMPKIMKYYSTRYSSIQNEFLKNYQEDSMPLELKWIKDFKFKEKKSKLLLSYEKIVKFFKRILKKIIGG